MSELKLKNLLQQYMVAFRDEKGNLNALRPQYATIRAEFSVKQHELATKRKELAAKQMQVAEKFRKVNEYKRLMNMTGQKIRYANSQVKLLSNKLTRLQKSSNNFDKEKGRISLAIRKYQEAINGSVNNPMNVAKNRANAMRR